MTVKQRKQFIASYYWPLISSQVLGSRRRSLSFLQLSLTTFSTGLQCQQKVERTNFCHELSRESFKIVRIYFSHFHSIYSELFWWTFIILSVRSGPKRPNGLFHSQFFLALTCESKLEMLCCAGSSCEDASPWLSLPVRLSERVPTVIGPSYFSITPTMNDSGATVFVANTHTFFSVALSWKPLIRSPY